MVEYKFQHNFLQENVWLQNTHDANMQFKNGVHKIETHGRSCMCYSALGCDAIMLTHRCFEIEVINILCGATFFGKRFPHQYCVILEEITPATQHSPNF